MDVGFVGLGHMGTPMARNLLRAGHRVVVWNRTRARAEALVADGAAVADRPGDAARGDAVITMVADDAALEDVVFGADGLLASLGPRTVHVSSSTIGVALSERLAAEHERVGRPFVAAPVFGRPEAAAAAKLSVVAAGSDEAIERCRPIFEALGQRTFVVGPRPPMANVVKLSGNFLIAAAIESMGEAVALVRRSDIDPAVFLGVLTETLFAAPAYKTYGALIAGEKYEPAGFALRLGLKDVRLALAAAEARAVPMPVASLVRDHFLSAIAHGDGDADWAALARVAAREAGLY